MTNEQWLEKHETLGGFAFPSEGLKLPEGGSYRTAGMTLRDWFAGQALASIMQDKAIWDCTSDERLAVAKRMYRWADAMLEARK